MPQVDRPGLFRGEIKDYGVTLTSKAKLPQFVATFLADELYNEATEKFEEWNYDQTITGYFVLVTTDQHGNVIKCFPYDDIMAAVGWDGVTYSGLAAMDLKGNRVQFRVGEDTYDGNTRLKVMQIAAEDADIGLRKLSGKDLTDIDAKFGVASAAKPKTAATPKKKVAAPKSKKPKPPKATPPKAEKPAESCTETEAYQACCDANTALTKPVPSEVMDDYWVTNVTEIAVDTDNVTGEEWVKIRNKTLESIEIPF